MQGRPLIPAALNLQQGTLLEQTGDDALDQRDLSVLETLEPPSVKLETEDAGLVREALSIISRMLDLPAPQSP